MFQMILTTFLSITLLASSALDLKICVDPTDIKSRSHLEILSQVDLDCGPFSAILQPEISVYLNKTADFSIGIGHRWHVPLGRVGHHIFFDRSQFSNFSSNQVGTCLDYLTDYFDFRLSYHHPLTKSFVIDDFYILPCRWLQSELVLKPKFVNIGISHIYNFETKNQFFQSKFTIPFEHFDIGIGGTWGANSENSLFLVTSFHIYKMKNKDQSNSYINHTKRMKFFHKKVEIQKEFPKVAEEDSIKEEEIIGPAVQESEIPVQIIYPEEKSWWEKLKSFFLQ